MSQDLRRARARGNSPVVSTCGASRATRSSITSSKRSFQLVTIILLLLLVHPFAQLTARQVPSARQDLHVAAAIGHASGVEDLEEGDRLVVVRFGKLVADVVDGDSRRLSRKEPIDQYGHRVQGFHREPEAVMRDGESRSSEAPELLH